MNFFLRLIMEYGMENMTGFNRASAIFATQ